MTRSKIEHDSQVAVIRWADIVAVKRWPKHAIQLQRKVKQRLVTETVFPLFAVPNGGHRHKAVAAQMRAEGVRSGVPDLILPISIDEYSGLVIEMKTAKGKCSKNQLTWLNLMILNGYATAVCHSSIDAIDQITTYLTGHWATVAQNID